MGWDRIIEQERVVEVLSGAVARGRVAHAYLFHGPDGTGKRAAALALAQALECERKEQAPCGMCLPCDKVRRMIHPDVQVLLPYPSDTEADDLAERLQLLAEEPFAAIDYVRRPSLSDAAKSTNKQAFYQVDRIREEVRRAASLKPVEGRNKVFVITDADLLRSDAGNAFLKILEEPTDRTVFILTTSRPDRLLPTVLSRCQKLRFDRLSADAIEKALQERRGLDASRSAMIARMADGSYTRALALIDDEDLMQQRELVIEFLRRSYGWKVEGLAEIVDTVASSGREGTKAVLRLLVNWIRDLALYRAAGADAVLVNVDQAKTVADFCNGVPRADLDRMVRLVEEAAYLAERNVSLTMLLLTLARALYLSMRGRAPERLYTPLVETALEAR
jgi:DNA polymerase III subunit delta'